MRNTLPASSLKLLLCTLGSALIACSGDATHPLEAPALSVGLAAKPDASTCGRLFAINEQNELLVLEPGGKHADKDKKDKGDDYVAIVSRQPITGLAPGHRLVGIDFRPATGQLYALGSPAGGSGLAQLYTIDTETAVATPVGPGLITLAGTSFGFDFNPVPDRIRVTSNLGQNLRLNPETGTLAAVDGPLAYAATDPNAGRAPSIVGSAYINPVAGATLTTLYDIDSRYDLLAIQNPPNSGTLNTVGSLGFNTGDAVGFDIGPTNEAFAVLQEGDQPSSRLFSINLSTGGATDLGRISEKKNGPGELVTGLAIELGPQCPVSS